MYIFQILCSILMEIMLPKYGSTSSQYWFDRSSSSFKQRSWEWVFLGFIIFKLIFTWFSHLRVFHPQLLIRQDLSFLIILQFKDLLLLKGVFLSQNWLHLLFMELGFEYYYCWMKSMPSYHRSLLRIDNPYYGESLMYLFLESTYQNHYQ